MQPEPLCTRSWHLNTVSHSHFDCTSYLKHHSRIPFGSSNCPLQLCKRTESRGLGCLLNCRITVQRCINQLVEGRLALKSFCDLQSVPVALIVLTQRIFERNEDAYTRLTSHACKAAHELCQIFERIHELPHHCPEQRSAIQSRNKSCNNASQLISTSSPSYTLTTKPVVAITVIFPSTP